MKKFFMIAALFAACVVMNAQNVKLEGKTYMATKASRSKEEPKVTGYDWQDSKGNKYPIFISGSGSCFVIRVSQKTGKEYRQYLGEEISRDICKKLGIEYKPKNKK